MPTIKELYDAGQRQFPMRGGGISLPIHYCYEKDLRPYFTTSQCEQEWELSGEFRTATIFIEDNVCELDLLPEPLPNQSDKDQRIATLEAALTEATDLIEKLHYEHLLGMSWLEDEEARFRAIAGGQDND